MSTIITNPSRDALRAFLRTRPALHLYELGDLDEPFWSRTSWWALADESGTLTASVLKYAAPHGPVIIAMSQDDDHAAETLVAGVLDSLPDTFYAHVTLGLRDALGSRFELASHGVHLRMALRSEAYRGVDTSAVVPLEPANLAAIMELYDVAYPDHWFDPRTLELPGCNMGVWNANKLVAIAGTHVWAPEQRVASLGNITTHPTFRGRGLSTAVTAALCASLGETVDVIGLNVRADNSAAIRVYAKLGFERVVSFEEFNARRSP